MAESFIFLLIALSVAIIVLLSLYLSTKKKLDEMQGQLDFKAQEQYRAWREKELEAVRIEQKAIARRESLTELDRWKTEYETVIRQDAIGRSKAVITGKVTEHLIPYMPVFPYNPKDARFIGSPIDIIVFDGADEDALRNVVFLEVKTGNTSLSQRQKQIRDAIQEGRVLWRELRVRP